MYGYRTGWRARPSRPMYLTQQNITGMRDNLDPSAAVADKAQLLRNIYPVAAMIGGGLVGRPGFREFAAAIDGTTASRGQRVYQYTQLDGTEHTLVFVGGRVYEMNWAARTLTDLTALLPYALDPTAHIGICTFADGVFFHDGVSKPIFGGYSAGAWTFTSVANAPVLFGEPVVYYAKVTGIRADERNVIVWSEENDPFNGYETFPYNNAWQLAQTETEPLYALAATNEALYYFRARSISHIMGPTSDEFQTAGVQESVSTTIGTVSPWAVALSDNAIYFIDSDARPQRILRGAGLQDPGIWQDAEENTRGLPRSMLGEALACSWTVGGLVLFAVSVREGARPELILGFDAGSGAFVTTWRTRGANGTLCSLDLVKNSNGVPTLIHTNDQSGLYDWGDPKSGSVWDDAGVAIDHIFVGGALGYDHITQKRFDRIDLSLRLEDRLTDMRIAHTVPKGTTAEVSITDEGSNPLWDVVAWDQFTWAGDTIEEHLAIGVADEGRWIQVRLRHSGLGERFGLLGYTVTAYPIGNIPSAR